MSDAAAVQEQVQIERGEAGYFKPGNSELGRVGARASAAAAKKRDRFIQLLCEAVTDDDIRQIIEKAVNQAKRGNRFAREFLWAYAVGKPKQMIELADTQSPFVLLFQQYLLAQVAQGQAQAQEIEDETTE